MIVYCPRLKGPKPEVESPKLGGHDNVWKTYEHLKNFIICVKDNEKFGKGQGKKSGVEAFDVRGRVACSVIP